MSVRLEVGASENSMFDVIILLIRCRLLELRLRLLLVHDRVIYQGSYHLTLGLGAPRTR